MCPAISLSAAEITLVAKISSCNLLLPNIKPAHFSRGCQSQQTGFTTWPRPGSGLRRVRTTQSQSLRRVAAFNITLGLLLKLKTMKTKQASD